MMRLFVTATLCALALSACNGAPPNEKILAQGCNSLFADDAGILDEFVRGGEAVKLADFCDCYASSVVVSPERTAIHKDALSALLTSRTETDRGVEAAARRVMTAIDDGEIDTFTRQQFDDMGEYFEDVGEGLSRSGTCPAL